MPDRGALLYLTALLHDVGKRVSQEEAKNLLAAEWKKRYCPPRCPQEKCPFEHLGHPLRGALFLLLAGFPQEYANVVAGVFAHHKQDNLCSLFVEQFAKLTGTLPTAQKNQIRLDSAYGSDLKDFFSRADHLASSVSRIDLQSITEDTKVLLFSGKPERCSPFWVFLDSFQISAVRPSRFAATKHDELTTLLADQTVLARLLESPDFFSHEWTAFRNSLFTWLAPAPEAQPDPKGRETTFSIDVSVSTHTALAAGIAMCYFRNGKKPATPKPGAKPIPSELLVVCLTFNGAEKVVEVPSDGALRQLRGRAASVSLLVDSFIRRLLGELELPPECILVRWYSGAFLLVPNRYSQKQKDTREVLGRIVQSLEKDFSEIPAFAHLRVTFVPIYLDSRATQTTDKEPPSGEQLYLHHAVCQAWRLAAYGHRESEECELVWAGKPRGQIGLTGASRCRVCGSPFSKEEGLCSRCQAIERLGVAINQGKFAQCGLHVAPKKVSPPVDAAYSLKNLRVYVAPGGWPWQPPVGPGSPQQELEKPPAEDRPKVKIGIALVRCGVVERLLSELEKTHLLPARLAECFRLADGFFEALRREEKGVWALRWSPAEALLMGRAEATLELLEELPELCKKNFGFAPEEMNLKAALAICPLDAPWREAADRLRSVLDSRLPDAGAWAFLADGAPFSPQLAAKLLAHARQTGPDGKYALDALQTALCRGRKPGGYDALEASSALILLEARARDKRRQAVAEARKILAEEKAKSFWSTLLGTSPAPEDLLGWLQEKVESGQAAHALATLAVARRLLPG